MINDPPPAHWLKDDDDSKTMLMTKPQIEGLAECISRAIMKCIFTFSAVAFILGLLVGILL